jgi:tetratricopeptide (TPR) repeat protein
MNQGNHAGAEEAFSKAVELDPENADAWRMISIASFQDYYFKDCMEYSLQGLEHTDDKNKFFKILSEIEIRMEKVPHLLELFEKHLQSDKTAARQKAYLYFYRASILLHGKDFTPFRADLQAGATILNTLTEDERKTVQGDLIDYLNGITYGDCQDEIITYLENLREIAPDIAAVFAPLDYVVEYLQATAQESQSVKKEKTTAVKRVQTVLDRVPTELKAPVEEMVTTIKNNNEWWAKRPKDKALLKSRS